STTLKTTVKANTTISGAIAESREDRTFLEVLDDAPINSLEERSVIRSIAISAPPMPTLSAVVIEIALDTAAVLDAVLVTVTMVDSMLPLIASHSTIIILFMWIANLRNPDSGSDRSGTWEGLAKKTIR
ncbi:MAG: hypothetical protein FJY85_03825, partial [Deltaproteobacteria bacterium]|nr:hypothetical protein [Deltaproteobacteria bacterium]